MKRCVLLLIALLLIGRPIAPAFGQADALNLPTDLYVLLNAGVVQRFGLGASGIVNITPPDTFVIDFAISPDDSQIAYRTEEGLVIADMSAGLPVMGSVVDTLGDIPPIRGRGQTMAWSPQGDTIAYTSLSGVRVYYPDSGDVVLINQTPLVGVGWSADGRHLVAEANNNIWWIYRHAGTQFVLRAAIPSSMGTVWIDNSRLVFAPEAGGLLTMDLDSGNAQTALLDDNAAYRLPTLAPDGRLLFFRRFQDSDSVPEGYGELVALSPGSPRLDVLGATPIDLSGGLQWAPGAEFMIAFQGGVLALFDPATGQGFPLPVGSAVAYSWGMYPPAPAPGDATPEAIFPDAFPTLDPLTALPGVVTVTPVPAVEETPEA